MRAWVLHGINDLQLNDVPMPTPKDGEVIVSVRAAGICASDISRVYSTGSYHYPIILGHEFSGVVERVHNEKNFGPVGKRVGVFPLIPCFTCESCADGRYETCSDYSYIGSRRDGAFAEYVAVPEWNLIILPDGMTFDRAALLEPASVALHAVRSIKNHNISRAAVIGDGAIGRLIGAWLIHCGVESVDVLGRNDNGILVNYDVCIAAAGSFESFRRCIELARPNGELVLVGNPSVDFNIGRELYWQILRKQLTVSGIWNSSYPSDWQSVIENAENLHLDKFISHKYEFGELGKAFDMIYNKRERHGKVIVTL
jgi:L-iditol 2-dehydrogenase